LLCVFVQRAIVPLGYQRPQDRLARRVNPPRPPAAVRLGAAPALRIRLAAPQIHRRETDAKALSDRCWGQTGFPSQQHTFAQIG
jgi:hypothetical protein